MRYAGIQIEVMDNFSIRVPADSPQRMEFVPTIKQEFQEPKMPFADLPEKLREITQQHN